MIYLSNFITAGNDDRAISIARIAARGFPGEKRPDLAPTQKSLTLLHQKKITVAEFAIEYMHKMYEHIDFQDEAEMLDGKVLLCHCDKQKFCHRALFGMFLHVETGIEVAEIGGYGDWFLQILAEIKSGKGYPIDWILDKDTIDFFDLSDITDGGLIGHWQALSERGLLALYGENYDPNDLPEEYYQKFVKRYLKENDLTLDELYELDELSRKTNTTVDELLAKRKKRK
jgi:hypothetical protein